VMTEGSPPERVGMRALGPTDAKLLSWIPLAALLVKAATEMQLRPIVEARRAAHTRFVGEALGLHPASPLPVGQLAALMTAFRRMWFTIRGPPCNGRLLLIRWENANKEA
jgi:hypothetical protein